MSGDSSLKIIPDQVNSVGPGIYAIGWIIIPYIEGHNFDFKAFFLAGYCQKYDYSRKENEL
jgi:hypothetical protein